MANLNVTYGDMQSAAGQLNAGEQQINSDLARLKKLIDNLVASGYVTDSSSRQFQASYEEFNAGATKMIAGLTGMSQYLNSAAKAFQETDSQLASALKQ
jgi:WXG100 family type VII secretion target